MSSISTIRHDEIFDAKANNQQITIIGVGATGSRIFAALVELGLTKITVIDFDVVEAHNLANQLYAHCDIGLSKVAACARWYMEKTGTKEVPATMKFFQAKAQDAAQEIKGSVFLLTDTMASRREIFDTILRDNPNVYRVVETRMASTHGNVYVFNPNVNTETDAWLDTLIDDSQGEVSACGAPISVGTTASIIANLAVWQFMHSKVEPAAGDAITNVFLKPFCLSTETLGNVQQTAA